MATYSSMLKGYIADVPMVIFKRCDNKVFAMDELTSATVSANIDNTEIRAGWSLFAVAVLPGQSTFTMSFTSGKFDAAMFSMANKTEFATNSEYAMPTLEYHTPSDAHTITLLENPISGTVKIAGLEETEDTPATGQFKVTTTTVGEAPDTKTVGLVTFYASDEFDAQLEVIYDYTKTVQEAIITNKESAIGEATAIWPVYGSGDDCSQSAIVGYYVVKVFRARITTLPGVDTSYKTAATFNFELTALDAKRNDQGAYSTAYYKA